MGEKKPPKVFLDTSALFARIWSEVGGGRAILRLGEIQAIHILSSSQVLSELENAFREKAPDSLSKVILLIHSANIEITPAFKSETRRRALRLVKYEADAEILAAALESQVEYFITLDKQHFLSNTKLRGKLEFPIGTPGDFLQWFRERLLQEP